MFIKNLELLMKTLPTQSNPQKSNWINNQGTIQILVTETLNSWNYEC